MNPIVELREHMNMDRRQFSFALDCSYQQVYVHEAGLVSTIQRSMRTGLERLGVDVADMERRFEEWRKAQRDALLA